MEIEYDPAKREWTLQHRGLDFADAGQLFDGFHMTVDDPRDYGNEERLISLGRIGRKTIVCVWTERDGRRRIIP